MFRGEVLLRGQRSTNLGMLDAWIFPRLRDAAVVPEDWAVVETQLASLRVLYRWGPANNSNSAIRSINGTIVKV